MAKPASLKGMGGALFSRKGEAAPDGAVIEAGAASAPVEGEGMAPVRMTVKLDGPRYVQVRTLAAQRRRSAQDIMVEALDEYLRKRAEA